MFNVKRLWQSTFTKFFVAFLIIGLIPLFALSVFSLQTFTGHVQQYTENNLRQMSLYLSYNINNVFTDYNEVSKLMYTGRYEGFRNSINQTHSVNELEQINDMPIDGFLKMILYSNSHIKGAFFVREMDGKIYYQTRGNTPLLLDEFPVDVWLAPLIDEPNRLAIHPTHADNYYFYNGDHVMTFGRNLIDTTAPLRREANVVGTLFFDVNVSLFEDLFMELSLGPDDNFYVVDGDGHLFYSKDNILDVEMVMLSARGENYFSLSEDIPNINGQVIIQVSNEGLYEQLTSTRTTVYIAIIICTLVLIIMGTWFSRRMSAPIKGIIQQMVLVESGNLDVEFRVYKNDEIGRLAYGFNRMLERLKEFINEAYVADIEKKQAELNALKSQIRPHYLYNTLEVIRMNAVHNEDEVVADMIFSLSNQLKYVIDYGENWVSIKRELKHVQDYFYIIDVRYENRFKLRFDIADDVHMDYQILKLTLQPLIENAIQHGVRLKGGKGTVLVKMVVNSGDLLVTIIDDGVGIDEVKLAAIKQKLDDPGEQSKHVGLKNVHERIKSVCGEQYGLEIKSKENFGTSVHLKFPIKKGEM